MTDNHNAYPQAANVGTSPAFLLFLVFLVLKLTAVIDWSWWWVTAPLWIPIALMAFFFGFMFTLEMFKK